MLSSRGFSPHISGGAGRFAFGHFVLLLAALLFVPMIAKPSQLAGDFEEYTLMTIALANHGTPAIESGDVAVARQLMPSFKAGLDALMQGMAARQDVPKPGYHLGLDGKTYAIHFFAYSALAAVPFKLFQSIGVDPLRCFQTVNLAAVFVLGLCLFRLFGTAARAMVGVGMFALCGGVLYWNWSSPECMSAAALLAGFACFASVAPRRGGLLIGIASLQNPSIVLALGVGPALQYCVQFRRGADCLEQLRSILSTHMQVGLAMGLMLFSTSPLFNLLRFGVPSIIAKLATDASLISAVRLNSLFFDLNQGMVIAVPGITAALLLWGWRGKDGLQRLRQAMLLVLCVLVTVGLATPALAVKNWNSDAAGVMRYAFWCAMPLVFALLWRLHETVRWPRLVIIVICMVQAGAMGICRSYNYLEFSQLAKRVMQLAPYLYNPEPEIFAERSRRVETYLDPAQVYSLQLNGKTVKTMFNRAGNAHSPLCDQGKVLVGGDSEYESTRSWVYVNNDTFQCATVAIVDAEQFRRDSALAVEPLQEGLKVVLGEGWSNNEPEGIWSDSVRSTLTVVLPEGSNYRHFAIHGHYLDGNSRTRVTVNGMDLGWHNLQSGVPLAFPEQTQSAASLRIELQHEAPRSPGPQDGRLLAFSIRQVTLR